MAQKKEPKFKMSPQEYRDFLEKIELESIMLDTCALKTNRQNLSSDMKLDIGHKVSFSLEDETTASVISNYNLVATKSVKKDFALKISAAYTVILSAKEDIPKEFMDIFVNINIQMHTWPFFRELVQSLTQKSGLPPLTLPLLRQ